MQIDQQELHNKVTAIHELYRNYAKIKADHNLLQRKYKSCLLSLKTARNENQVLTDNVTNEYVRKQVYESVIQEREQLRLQHDALKNDYNSSVNDVQFSYQSTCKALNILQSDYKAVVQKCDELKCQNRLLESANDSVSKELKEENDDLSRELEECRKTCSKSMKENDQLRLIAKDYDELKKKYAASQSTKHQLTQEKDQLHHSIRSLEATMHQLKSEHHNQVTKLTEEHRNLVIKSAALNNEYLELRKQRDNLEFQVQNKSSFRNYHGLFMDLKQLLGKYENVEYGKRDCKFVNRDEWDIKKCDGTDDVLLDQTIPNANHLISPENSQVINNKFEIKELISDSQKLDSSEQDEDEDYMLSCIFESTKLSVTLLSPIPSPIGENTNFESASGSADVCDDNNDISELVEQDMLMEEGCSDWNSVEHSSITSPDKISPTKNEISEKSLSTSIQIKELPQLNIDPVHKEIRLNEGGTTSKIQENEMNHSRFSEESEPIQLHIVEEPSTEEQRESTASESLQNLEPNVETVATTKSVPHSDVLKPEAISDGKIINSLKTTSEEISDIVEETDEEEQQDETDTTLCSYFKYSIENSTANSNNQNYVNTSRVESTKAEPKAPNNSEEEDMLTIVLNRKKQNGSETTDSAFGSSCSSDDELLGSRTETQDEFTLGFHNNCWVVTAENVIRGAKRKLRGLVGPDEQKTKNRRVSLSADLKSNNSMIILTEEESDSEFESTHPDSPERPVTKLKKRMGFGTGQSLISDMLQFCQNNDAVFEVAQNFLEQTPEFIAKLVLERVSKDIHDSPAKGTYPMEPRLTVVQKGLYKFMMAMEKLGVTNVCRSFLREADLYIRTVNSPVLLEPVTRLYVAVCKANCDYAQMRMALCSALTDIGDLAVPYINTVLQMWIEVLPKKDMTSHSHLVPRTIVQLILLKNVKQPGYNLQSLRTYLFSYCGYPSDGYDTKQLFKELIDNYLDEQNECARVLAIALTAHVSNQFIAEEVIPSLIPVSPAMVTDRLNSVITLIIHISKHLGERLDSSLLQTNLEWLRQFSSADYSAVVRDHANRMLSWYLQCDSVPYNILEGV